MRSFSAKRGSAPAAAIAAEEEYRRVRQATLDLTSPLSAEDCAIQSMSDASPAKWHLAHTSWFFETFILSQFDDYEPFDAAFGELFNSYYNGVGPQFPRSARGMLSRPSLSEICDYRRHVDDAIIARQKEISDRAGSALQLGLQHEQQHQELLLTDIKHLLSLNPLAPAYVDRWPLGGVCIPSAGWIAIEGGVRQIGATGDGFYFDNEAPRHATVIADFEIASLPTTNGQFLSFIEDGGYQRPELWLDAGWAAKTDNRWEAPLYWSKNGHEWRCFTLHGDAPLDENAPVCHVSFFEAEAFARWSGARLPTEAEWELASRKAAHSGNFLESGLHHPTAPGSPLSAGAEISQMFGDVWEWTRSDYAPYPGYVAPKGAIGEYNGKFMSGQYVLRGGSCATPSDHIRATYRNFFPPSARWQFSGVRLARDAARPSGVLSPAKKTVMAPRFIEAHPPGRSPEEELHQSLMAEPPSISPKYFYDFIGSQLFETITRLPEYYIPGAEAEIFAEHARAIAASTRKALGPRFQIVDVGAGNCEKGEKILAEFNPDRYVAVDISSDFLRNALVRLQSRFPTIEMAGVGADFSKRLALPASLQGVSTLAFIPGSSLGNFSPADAGRLLRSILDLGPRTAILLGVDLIKDRATLETAYDDPAGVTAAFNRNILQNANRIIGADFDPSLWRHVAFFNEPQSRIEMHLEARKRHVVRWRGGERRFVEGERILTEYSRKWREDEIVAMLKNAGFSGTQLWTDKASLFAIALGSAPDRVETL